MSKLPWFPFYGRDFYLDEKVRLLSLRQEAMYLRLLWHQWEEGSIPNVAACQSLPEFRVHTVDWMEDKDDQLTMNAELAHVHLTCFQAHHSIPDRFLNPRLEAVRSEQLEKTERLHQRAIKGGQALAFKRKLGLSQPQAKLKQAIQSQIQRKKKNLNNPDKSVVPTNVKDRSGTGFTPLVTEIMKAAQSWPKEIP